jgi:N-acetylglutamate synthase-like GNAT family acetyltransferase
MLFQPTVKDVQEILKVLQPYNYIYSFHPFDVLRKLPTTIITKDEDDKVTGICRWHFQSINEQETPIAVIEVLLVEEKSRRQGYGKHLMKDVIMEITKYEVGKVYLNAITADYFHQFGFKNDPVINGDELISLGSVPMSKELKYVCQDKSYGSKL